MINLNKLKEEQIKLAKKVINTDSAEKIITIAGADQSYADNKVISAIAVCDYKSLEVIEEKHAVVDAKIPYKSGFLFYRDGPAVIEAFNKLENKPDVLILKGNGILHPRRIGMASQVGLLLDTATIGVAKKLMLGQVKGNTIYVEKEARGYKITTREHAKPIYVSPGYKVSLKTSLEVIKNCLRYPHKLPEPLHLAQKYGNKVRKELLKNSKTF
ncbi:MAG: endonuclease V [Nanoarchaeota archaeon]|nr:endonuclease V [Nanoarchaeota archaeon]